ncbi:hypothetical protein ACMC5R_03885 [Deferribacteres bacterium DY0037]
MRSASDLSIERLKNESGEFKLIDILGIRKNKEYKYEYIALFFNGYKYLNCPIPFELYYGTYIGAQYSYGKIKTNISKNAQSKLIEFDPAKIEYTAFRNIINAFNIGPSVYDHSFSSDDGGKKYQHEILNQNVATVNNGNSIFILPCFLIASTFYFTSSKMVNMIMTGNFNDALYGDIEFNKNGVPIVFYKKSYPTSDIPYVVLYHTSSHAKYLWNRLRFFRKPSSINYLYTDTKLPYNKIKTFKCYVSKLPSKTHNVYRIIGIPFSDTFFDYKLYVRATYEDITGSQFHTIDKENPQTTDILSEKSPNNKFITKVTRVELQQNEIIKSNIAISDLVISSNKGSDTYLTNLLDSDEITNLGFGDPTNNGQNTPTMSKRPEKPTVSKEYKIKGTAFGFIDEIANILQSNYGCTLLRKTDGRVPRRKKKSKRAKLTLRESYDGTLDNMRAYRFVEFLIENRHVVLVDIDFDKMETRTSVFILIGKKISDADIKSLLQHYVDSTKYVDIEKEMSTREIQFHYKKHTDKPSRLCYKLLAYLNK